MPRIAMETSIINVTPKLKADVTKLAKQYGIREEALVGYLLRDDLSDHSRIEKAAKLIKSTDMGGASSQMRRGW
jgi:hypothetical protein